MAKAKSASAAAFDPSMVEVVRQLVFPTLKVDPGVPVHVKVLEAMFQGRQIESETGADGKPTRGPATILKVHVYHGGTAEHELNGQDAQIVANKLLVGYLKDNYPEDAYVGKCFKIVKSSAKKKGKNGEYYSFQLYEFAEPA